MSKPRNFKPGPWVLHAELPPCDPDHPARAFRQCAAIRHDLACTCKVDVERLVDDMETCGITDLAGLFEDEMSDGEIEAAAHRIRRRISNNNQSEASERVLEACQVIEDLAAEGSGLIEREDVD